MIDITHIIVAVAAIVLTYTWYQVFQWRKKIKEQQQKTDQVVNKAFFNLQRKIEKQIEMLDGEPGLNEEERKIRDELQEALNSSEKVIREKIKNIDDKKEEV